MSELSTVALVDLDDTLLHYRAEEDAAAAALAAALGADESMSWSAAYRWAKETERRSTPPGTDRLVNRIQLVASALGIEVTEEAARRLRATYAEARVRTVTLLPGAMALLKHVRSTFDVMLLCTTGVHDLQVARARAAGIDNFFDDLLVSDVRGADKDDWPRFLGSWFHADWHYAVISDRAEPDLLAARASGMFAVGIGEGAGTSCHLRAAAPDSLVSMLGRTSLLQLTERYYRRDVDA